MEQNATAQTGAREAVALNAKSAAIYGVKAGMTQVYSADGDVIAVTVIDLKPNVITQVKTKATDGYNAIQLGILEKKAKAANKAEQGHYKKISSPGFYVRKEIRLADNDKLDGLTAGKTLSIDFLKEGDFVDLTAISKGKGFQGGVKRFHMAGGFKSHGASLSHRQLGSIGNRADPAKCFKNKKMPGQMGNVKRTVQNIKVVGVDKENQILLVHGSVPGPKSGIVTVRKAIKG
ncbi:MAG: 50S ribosomal protein L3 [Bdellovibrionales bacterium]|nr:50S ribosomal protein L3 [Bdellovibrionales bacterium]